MEAEFTYLAANVEHQANPCAMGRPQPLGAARLAHAIEDAGFARIVAEQAPGIVSGLAEVALEGLSGLAVTWPHRAGSMDPVAAARQIAAVDASSDGRAELRIDAGVRHLDSGIPLTNHVARTHYLDEYLVLLKWLLSNDRPFEHQGRHFSVNHGYVPRKGPQGAAIPIRLTGLTGSAARVAACHADVLELPAIAPDHARRHIHRIREMAALFGRGNRIRFAMPFDIGVQDSVPLSDATSLAGTPEEVVVRLLQYADAGVSEFMIAGLATEESIAAFGRTIQPLASNSIRRLAPSNVILPPTKPVSFATRA